MKLKTSDGFILDGSFTKVNKSTKGIIFLHGMTVARDDEGIFVRAEPKLNKLGFSTLRFDFRAHGKSSGDSVEDFTISGELIDLDTAVQFMKKQGVKWLGFAAASFGGSIAALYVGNHRVDKLFLANPVLDYDKAFLNPTTVWAMKNFINLFDRLKRFGFIEVASRRFKMGKPLTDEMKKFFPFKELAKYKGQLLIVHGDKDDKVDIKHVKHYFEELSNHQKDFVIMKGSDHGFHKEPYETQVVKNIVNFFKNE